MKHEHSKTRSIFGRMIFLTIGAILAATALKALLIPNQIIDGGVIGISILLGYKANIPVGLLIMLLNLPFLFLGYKHIGKTFTISTLYAVSVLAIGVTVIQPKFQLTDDLFLISVFGGIILGAGVGIIIRYGGSLDGTEIVAILLDEKIPFSIGEIIMFFNVFILGSAGFVFGWEKAMYSLVTYFVAYKIIDVVIEGVDEAKAITIVSDNYKEIAEALKDRLGRGVTLLSGMGGYTGDNKTIIYSVVSRLEIAKAKSIIVGLDKYAFVTITDVYDVMEGKLKKKAIH